MNKEDKRKKKQPFNEIDTDCLDYIVNKLKSNKSMQKMVNYYKSEYYIDRYWKLKVQVVKAIEYIQENSEVFEEKYLTTTNNFELIDLLNILEGANNA